MDEIGKQKITEKKRRCVVRSVCGHSLYEGVCFVAIASLIIAGVTFVVAMYALKVLVSKDLIYGKHPVWAVYLIQIMVHIPMSVYQMIISFFLWYQAVKLRGDAFLGSLWLSSHVVICLIYGIIFIIKIVVSFNRGNHIIGPITILSGITYEALFIYFCIIVRSYLKDSDLEIFI